MAKFNQLLNEKSFRNFEKSTAKLATSNHEETTSKLLSHNHFYQSKLIRTFSENSGYKIYKPPRKIRDFYVKHEI